MSRYQLANMVLLLMAGLALSVGLHAQGFLRAEGKNIVNGDGENVVLRGIGTGNWMLQEGYMMKTAGVAGTQHEFRAKLEESIGEARTDSFYMAWLDNHMTRTDVDSMKAWGFNSIRPALHYKWFTLPIEDEPVAGQQTWLDTGFELLDSLVSWAADNEMYVILDLHGAPGGQGKNADISDYDPSKPSLWESEENKDKCVALWQKLAERYSDEPWVGGYDLINETNWTFPEGNNIQMRKLYMRITDSIRKVDTSHIIFIEGNSFANDFSSLTPPWDDNMAYSFHKYWSYNRANSLDWVLRIRNQHQVPLWLGESGENSNHWFTKAIALSEANNIGWSWWPVKKGGINNPLEVVVNDDYLQLIENWKGNGPFLSEDQAYAAVMTWAENHRIENCIYHPGVVDAMIRQPHTTETLPFRNWVVSDTFFASEYDYGRLGQAYFDLDSANYGGEAGVDYTAWNAGWGFRNDGVDIEARPDSISNGYIVGFTDAGEWLQFTMQSDSAAAYRLEIRSASEVGGGQVHLQVDGVDATGPVLLPNTGGWQAWQSTWVEDVILPAGEVQLRLYIGKSGANLNYFRFHQAKEVEAVSFRCTSASVDGRGGTIDVFLNKAVSSYEGFKLSDFSLSQNGEKVAIDEVLFSEEEGRHVMLKVSEDLYYNERLELSYLGKLIFSGEQVLQEFRELLVQNRLSVHYRLPGRVQAENFYHNQGFELEDCQDAGGGKNLAYANPGDLVDYLVRVEEAGPYLMEFRVSTPNSGARLNVEMEDEDGFELLTYIRFNSTGGWQNWQTQSIPLELDAGKYLLRLRVAGQEHNLNWFRLRSAVGTEAPSMDPHFQVYPNPASSQLMIGLGSVDPSQAQWSIWDAAGRKLHSGMLQSSRNVVDVTHLAEGLYFLRLDGAGSSRRTTFVIRR